MTNYDGVLRRFSKKYFCIFNSIRTIGFCCCYCCSVYLFECCVVIVLSVYVCMCVYVCDSTTKGHIHLKWREKESTWLCFEPDTYSLPLNLLLVLWLLSMYILLSHPLSLSYWLRKQKYNDKHNPAAPKQSEKVYRCISIQKHNGFW